MYKKINLSSGHKSFNCYSGSICYILDSQGTYLSEAMSMGLSAGLGFEMTLEPDFHFRCIREEHCLTEYLLEMGIRIEPLRIQDYQWFLNFIHNNIDKDIPVMVGYDGSFFPFTSSYKKEHESRIGVITGYYEKGVYFTDLVLNVTNYEIPYHILKYALYNYSSSEKLIHFFWVTYPIEIKKRITKEAVKEALISFTESYLNEKGNETVLKGKSGLITYVKNFTTILPKIIGVKDWNGVLIDLKQMSLVLNLYNQFISEVTALFLSPFDKETSDKLKNCFGEASSHWEMMCNALCRYKLIQKKEEMVIHQLQKFQLDMEEVFKILVSELM